MDVDDQVVIGHRLNLRPREEAVDQYSLPPPAAEHTKTPSDVNRAIAMEEERKRRNGRQSDLLLDAEGPDVAVGHIPGEEAVRILCLSDRGKERNSDAAAEDQCRRSSSRRRRGGTGAEAPPQPSFHIAVRGLAPAASAALRRSRSQRPNAAGELKESYEDG